MIEELIHCISSLEFIHCWLLFQLLLRLLLPHLKHTLIETIPINASRLDFDASSDKKLSVERVEFTSNIESSKHFCDIVVREILLKLLGALKLPDKHIVVHLHMYLPIPSKFQLICDTFLPFTIEYAVHHVRLVELHCPPHHRLALVAAFMQNPRRVFNVVER